MKLQRTILLRALTGLTILAVLAAAFSLTLPGRAAPAFNYAEALQKTILFYEAQRSGSLSTSSIPTRFAWKGDTQLTDGQAQGLDLTGGMVDAGDNMKYTFPMAQGMQTLAWGAVENRQAYVDSGQLTWLMNQLRWGNDWFIKAHPSANVLYHQVGDTAKDHNYWIPSVSTQYLNDSRTYAYKIDTTCPGSDVAADVGGAMATASIVFRPTDPTYANTLLTHAEQLYNFADTYRGKFSDCNPDPDAYISWSGYNDELVWDAIWLYKAEEAKSAGSGAAYLNKAIAYYPNLGLEDKQTVRKYKWAFNWDDKTYGAYVMMAKLVPGDAQYKADAERWLNWWTVGGTEYGADGTKVPYTPGGHARVDKWGSLRYAANTAFIAFVYSDWLKANSGDATKITRYHDFAVNQVNYILGQNPRGCSYIGGFGNCPPVHPHHRTAHGSWAQQQAIPAEHRHILYGALSGSPGGDDSFTDTIADAVSNEVALDYNAGISSALARMYKEYGGTPLPDSSFPLPDRSYTCKEEWGNFINYYTTGSGGIGPTVFVENRSGWPARATDKLKFRYFFTLDAADISDISVSAVTGATVSGPTLWNAANKVYYYTFDLTGTMIYPGYAYGPSGPEVSFSISSNSNTWDSSNDWSYQNIDSAYTGGWGSHKYGGNIPMYEGPSNTKLCGGEPGSGGTAQPTNTPTRTPTRTLTPAITNTPIRTSTNTLTPAITNTPTRTQTVGASPTRTLTPAISNTPTQIVGASPTRTLTPAISNTPTRTSTPMTTPTTGTGTCSPVTSSIAAPFTFDGAGTFCWQSTNLGTYVNSWNTTSVAINGVNITNLYMASSSYPTKIGGYWYISYNSSVAWGHFETK